MKLLPWEYGVRNLLRNPRRLAMGASGAGLVVLLVLTSGAFVSGMSRSLRSSGRAENVILLGVGSQESIERSEISQGAASQAAAGIPGIRTRLGQTYVSPEVYMQATFRRSPNDETDLPAVLRGVTPKAFLVHPELRVVAGRAPRPGYDELLVGRLAGVRMGLTEEELAIGRTLYLDGRPWTIVGRMAAPGTVMDAELWCDLNDLKVASRRESISAVVLAMDDGTFEDAEAFAMMRLDLELVAMREQDYYAVLSRFYRPVQIMAYVTAALIALGGLLGGLNMMYAAFSSRIRELASLQAVGFSRGALLVSLIQESVLMVSAGTLAACATALVALDGWAARFSVGAFEMTIDGPVLVTGLLTGLGLGIAGALPPALRCLKAPIPVALRTR